ncbi:MAG: DUF4440 domain-containing protein [Gaiellales bacterium]
MATPGYCSRLGKEMMMTSSGREGIEAVRAEWLALFNAGRMDELGERFYAEDAWAMPPGVEPIRGRGKIVQLFRDVYESGDDPHYELVIIETVAEGNLGYLVGRYSFTVDGKSVHGLTHETYRREADGSWKCVVDMWHQSEPT